MNMHNSYGSAVLIISYRRFDSLKVILEKCAQNNIKKIYVSVDGPKKNSSEEFFDNLSIKNVVNEFSRSYSGELFTNYREKNIGCSASILLSCNWIFKFEQSAIILEDDCIPADDFFKFANLSLKYMESKNHIWLACGTQVVQLEKQDSPWLLSKYPLVWGWATTRDKWNHIFASLLYPRMISLKEKNPVERIYWNSGARRAINGWVDTWDVILAQQMIRQNKKSIVSSTNLISNIGYDKYATNVDSSNHIGLKTSKFEAAGFEPKVNDDFDQWLKKNLYKISLRHLFTTQITRFKDFIRPKSPKLLPFTTRILISSSTKK
jgi:hypothetical protein